MTEDDPWRATAVPMISVSGWPGSTAIAPMERLVATAAEPATSVHVAPPFVDLNRPRPASESPDPLGSPLPA